jgi:hypothetical protein
MQSLRYKKLKYFAASLHLHLLHQVPNYHGAKDFILPHRHHLLSHQLTLFQMIKPH